MPIRHCQKCGLKVLIDESQAGANPFYCQRCTTAMKGSEAGADDLLGMAAAAPPAMKRAPVPAPAPASVATAAPAKPATVKVLCPYCKATFNGRVPQKPARGSCPVCQKELILLPNGDIRPAAGFDLNQWHAESAKPAAKESGTKMLVKKYAAEPEEPAAAAKKDVGTKVLARKAPETPPPPPPPAPSEETADEESSALPSWLDDPSEARESTKPAAEEESPAPAPEEEAAVRLEDPPPAGPPLEEEPPKRPPPAVLPPPPPPKAPPAPARRAAAPPAARRFTERRAVPAGADAGGPTGAGKFMFALLLAALPVAACGVLLGVRPKLKDTVIEKLGVRFSKGFKELDRRLNPPPPKAAPPAAPTPPPPPPEEPAKPGPEDQARDENEILGIWNKWRFNNQKIKQLSIGATEAQKADIEKANAEQKELESRMDSLCDRYKKTYGKEYDPRKQ